MNRFVLVWFTVSPVWLNALTPSLQEPWRVEEGAEQRGWWQGKERVCLGGDMDGTCPRF